jgi:hypothetical protein
MFYVESGKAWSVAIAFQTSHSVPLRQPFAEFKPPGDNK